MTSSKLLWRSTARSIVLSWVLMAIFVLVFGIVVLANASTGSGRGIEGAGWLGPLAVLALGMLISLWSSRLAVEIDADELRVRFGPGWPTRRIPWSRVISIEYLYVRPTQWGGWGYRASVLRRSQAAVLRAGDGLRLELSNGSTFVVTVDKAKQAVEVIRKLRAGE